MSEQDIYIKMLADIEHDIKAIQKTIAKHQRKKRTNPMKEERKICIYKDMLSEQMQRRSEILERLKGSEEND